MQTQTQWLDDAWNPIELILGKLARHRAAELIHARSTMLGTLQCLTPELLSTFSADIFKSCATIFSEDDLNYLSSPYVSMDYLTGIAQDQGKLLFSLLHCYRSQTGCLDWQESAQESRQNIPALSRSSLIDQSQL